MAGVEATLYPVVENKPVYFSFTNCPIEWQALSTALPGTDPPQIVNDLVRVRLKVNDEDVFDRDMRVNGVPAPGASGTVIFDSSHFGGTNQITITLEAWGASTPVGSPIVAPPVTIPLKQNRGLLAARCDWEAPGSLLALAWQDLSSETEQSPDDSWDYTPVAEGGGWVFGQHAWRTESSVYNALRNDGLPTGSEYTTSVLANYWSWSDIASKLQLTNVLYIATHGGSAQKTPLAGVQSRIVTDSNDFNIIYQPPPAVVVPTLQNLPKEFVFGIAPTLQAPPNNVFPSGVTVQVAKSSIKPAYDNGSSVVKPPLFNDGDAPFFFVYMAACNSGDTDHLARGFLYPYYDIEGGVENMAYIGYKGKRHMVQISDEAGAIFSKLKEGLTILQALEQVMGEGWSAEVALYGDPHTRVSSPYTGDGREPSTWFVE